MLKISPSKAASYFYHECERFLFLNSIPKKERSRLGVKEQVQINSSILAGGANWEEEVVTKYLKEDVLIADTDAPLTSRFFTVKQFEEWLINPSSRYIYQPTMNVVDAFYKEHNIDLSKIILSDCRPDLIEYMKTDGESVFRIIDIKSSDVLKVSHKVQISIYALILDALLKEQGINGRVDLSEAGVWIFGQDKPEIVSIENIVPYIRHFLSQTLHMTAEKEFDDLFWHLDFRCEWCSYFDYCLDGAKEQNHVTLLPYLSNQAGRYLKENYLPAQLDEMADFIKDDTNKNVLKKNISFKQRIQRMDTQLRSLINEEVLLYNSYSSSMPINENIQLILTVQKDQVSGNIFACSIYRLKGKDLFGSGSDMKHFVADHFEDCNRVQREFVDYLFDILSVIHDYNQEEEWSQQKSVQTYVTDNYELNNLIDILQELLLDNDYREKAVNLLFYFHSDVLSQSDEHPENVVPFPAITLTTTVSRLFAIPAAVAYKLEDLSNYIASKGDFSFHYERKEYLANKLSNVMKSDLIHQVWDRQENEKLDWIQSDLKARLLLASSVIDGIRKIAKDEEGNSSLFAWPDKFQFPNRYYYNHDIISKLAFMTQYETILQYLDIRERRSKSLEERFDNGDTLHLTYLGDYTFELHNKEVLQEISTSDAWILTEAGFFGEQQQLRFKDFPYRDKFYAPKNLKLYLADIKEIVNNDESIHVELDIKGKLNKFDLVIGHDYLLSVRYTDWTSNRVLNGIQAVDEENEGMIQLLQQANKYRKKFKPRWEEELVETLIRKKELTNSQSEAFKNFLNHTLTAVWGPPGTGKTHFIAMALLMLISIYEERGKRLKILISGFTHNAIENALVKVHHLKRDENVKIGKLNSIKSDKARVIELVNEKDVSTWLHDQKHVILGGTLYNAQKVYDKGWLSDGFDVVVLDEASQVKTADSLLALGHVKPKGRILIVGDHFQLPPIIQGEYKTNEHELNVYDSIFQLIMDQDVDGNITSKLVENFRMNEVLCRYPAEKIYGSQYTAYNEQIATQKIRLLDYEETVEDWVQKVIDPDYPLIVCVYDGVQETQENQFEADWVAEITKVFRSHLLNDQGQAYEDSISGDEEFWKEGLFIISPHNAQNRLIRSTLEREGLRPEFFVGTVDKMQGQESAVAIISYGVSDPELAVKEGEFLYSLNRLNVSLTRAQKKTVLFLSRKLMSPSLEVLGNDEYSKGVDFMINLESFAMKNGELVSYDVDGTSMKIYRVK